MSDNTIIYKRTPSIRCRIEDLLVGHYDEDDKSIETIFGRIRRARLYCTLLHIKISDEDNNEDLMDSMIKNSDGTSSHISFLLDDGTGSLWCTVFGGKKEHYTTLHPGDLIHTVGTVKKKENRLVFYPDFIVKTHNVNDEILHQIEMIEFLKKNGMHKVDKIEIQYEETKITEDDIDDFIKSQTHNNLTSPSESNTTNLNEFDEFDEFGDDGDFDYDESEIEDAIIETIRRNDKGDGIDLESIISKIGISRETVEEILKKLSLNTKIYSTKSGNFKLHI